MVNILIVAHSQIANNFANCVEHILSRKIDNLHVIGVQSTDLPDNIYALVQRLIHNLNSDVLILSDIFGATPCNIALKLIKPNRVELVTGLNLSMLIRAISYSDQPLNVCLTKAVSGGCDGVFRVTMENINDC